MKNGISKDLAGTKRWYKNGKLHRDDGPAIEYVWGDKSWYVNGLKTREDGPADDRIDGTKYWWHQGRKLNCNSQQEFERLLKLKAFW